MGDEFPEIIGRTSLMIMKNFVDWSCPNCKQLEKLNSYECNSFRLSKRLKRGPCRARNPSTITLICSNDCKIKELEQSRELLVGQYCLREIPNKPPPPYTPPKQSAPTQEEVLTRISQGGSFLWDLQEVGGDPKRVPLPQTYLPFIQDNSYREFMFDLSKEIYLKSTHSFPERPRLLNCCKKKIKNKEDLLVQMRSEAKIIFTFEEKPIRERNTIKWTRRKRDVIDEILRRECQKEDNEWTNFTREKDIIKSQISNEIFQLMIDDAVQALIGAFTRKEFAS